jgi:hypothetical protein
MISTVDKLDAFITENKIDAGVLDIGSRQGLKQDDMKAGSILRFTDRFGRKGVAFNLVTKKDIDVEDAETVTVPAGVKRVLAIFQRYPAERGTLVYGWGGSDFTIERVINTAHEISVKHESRNSSCDTCPISGMNFRSDVLKAIVEGTHEFVGLVQCDDDDDDAEVKDMIDVTMAAKRAKIDLELAKVKFHELHKTYHKINAQTYSTFRRVLMESRGLNGNDIQTDVIEAEVETKFIERQRKVRRGRRERAAKIKFVRDHKLTKESEASRIEAQIEAEWAAMTDEQKLAFSCESETAH